MFNKFRNNEATIHQHPHQQILIFQQWTVWLNQTDNDGWEIIAPRTGPYEDFFISILFFFLPMVFGSMCTLGLQFCWGKFCVSSINEGKTCKKTAAEEADVDSRACFHQRVATTRNVGGDGPNYIYVSSTGKAHKSAACCGKHASKITMCAKCFKWTWHHGGKKQMWSKNRFVKQKLNSGRMFSAPCPPGAEWWVQYFRVKTRFRWGIRRWKKNSFDKLTDDSEVANPSP